MEKLRALPASHGNLSQLKRLTLGTVPLLKTLPDYHLWSSAPQGVDCPRVQRLHRPSRQHHSAAQPAAAASCGLPPGYSIARWLEWNERPDSRAKEVSRKASLR